jgi:hypothetical protein
LIFFSDAALTAPAPQPRTREKRVDISHGWSVSFEGEGHPMEMQNLASWTDDPRHLYFSGRATYRKTIDIPHADEGAGRSVAIDFGEGKPLPLPENPAQNMRAYLESPVREAAQVFVNDELAGNVWHPPFRIDLSPFLKAGKNEIRIVVGNTAINELAGTTLPNYRLLYARYGKLFEPQGMEDLQPLPSGILGPVTLIESASAR